MLRKVSLFLCVEVSAYKTFLVDTARAGRAHDWGLTASSVGCLRVHGVSSHAEFIS